VALEKSNGPALLQPGDLCRDEGSLEVVQLEVSLLEGDKVKATQKDNLIILSAAALTAPWVYARVHQPPPSTEWMKLLASQHFLKGNYAEARKLLEDILARQPDDESRLLLAKTFYALGDYRKSLSLALPVYEKPETGKPAKSLPSIMPA